MQMTTVGIDLSKHVFQLHGVAAQGKVRLPPRVSRATLLHVRAQVPPCRVGREACGGAQYWARALTQLGHAVKIMAPQHVNPYVPGHTTDRREARAICAAACRPSVRAVPGSRTLQQDIQTFHRVRCQCLQSRTALVHQRRGLVAEDGLVLPKGLPQVRKRVGDLLAAPARGLSALCRELLRAGPQRSGARDARMTTDKAWRVRFCQPIEPWQRLRQVDGVGPLTATAFYAAVGNAQAGDHGRHGAAGLGRVPQHHSRGERTVL